MTGQPTDRDRRPRNFLEQLLWQEEYTYEEMARRFERRARELGERATVSPTAELR
jgi:hypothetical protein